jgi:hypothetical protein
MAGSNVYICWYVVWSPSVAVLGGKELGAGALGEAFARKEGMADEGGWQMRGDGR